MEICTSNVKTRVFPDTSEPLSEYVIYDKSPRYLAPINEHTGNYAQAYFYAGLIKGIMNYTGFECNTEVYFKTESDKIFVVVYIISFSVEVLMRERK